MQASDASVRRIPDLSSIQYVVISNIPCFFLTLFLLFPSFNIFLDAISLHSSFYCFISVIIIIILLLLFVVLFRFFDLKYLLCMNFRRQLPSEVASFVFPSKPESSSESSVSSNKKDESSQGSSANVSKPKASANDSLKSSVSSETSSDSRSGSGRQAWKSSSPEKNVNSDGFTNIDDPSENRGGSRMYYLFP